MTNAVPARAADLDLADFWTALMRIKIWILVAAVLGGAGATALALTLPPVYTAETVLLVSGDEEGSRLQGLAGLASRVGLGLGGLIDSSADRKVEAVATLQSRALTEDFIEEGNLLPVLFESRWDKAANKWSGEESSWPTPWEGTELFRTRVRFVAEDRRTGLVTLTVRWRDNNLAAAWANELVVRANTLLQRQAIVRSERNLAYLKSELGKGNTVEVQQSINNLIEAEINRAMLARGNEQYAFRVVDPAVVPEKSQLDRQFKVIASGTVLGGIAGALLALLLGGMRDRKRKIQVR